MPSKKPSQGIVYSTNPSLQSKIDNNQDLRVWLEHHGGKPLTIVREFRGSTSQLEALGKELKIKCGVGGAVKDGVIMIQGNQRDKVIKLLLEKGYKVKKAGG